MEPVFYTVQNINGDVGEDSRFQVDQHKAFQNVVVEHQINVKMLPVHGSRLKWENFEWELLG